MVGLSTKFGVRMLFTAVGIAAFLVAFWLFSDREAVPIDENRIGSRKEDLATFASCEELKTRLKTTQERQGIVTERFAEALPFAAAPGMGGDIGVQDYSRTNVQVEGVDEADIVKTDGNSLYLLSKNRLLIAQVLPPQEAKLLSSTDFGRDTAQEFFLNDDHLAVFGQRAFPDGSLPLRGAAAESRGVASPLIYPWYNPVTFLELYDVADRASPKLVRTLEFEGTYLTSRKIEGMAYLILQSAPNFQILDGEGVSPATGEESGSADGTLNATDAPESMVPSGDQGLVPLFRDVGGVIAPDQPFTPVVPCSGIAYPLPILDNQYITVIGLPMSDPKATILKEVVLGAGSTVYASLRNLYVSGVDYGYDRIAPQPLGIFESAPFQPQEETVVHKFALAPQAITHRGHGRVPGHVLNQFSMDEHADHFRIATTQSEQFGFWSDGRGEEGRQSTNAVYVLDEDLQRIGAIEDIAPGETIFSARFMGGRAYLVTFKKIDPFFVLDLKDPRNPKILGKLKIPGFSDYLHPYDETHIIGVGKNAEDAAEADFSWYQGIKIALFDVSDPNNPQELHKVDIGDRGTDSPALQNHKAFFFDSKRNLLVLPILLAEIDEAQKRPDFEQRFLRASKYGDFVFQGSYVYGLAVDGGFEFRGRVTHLDDPVAYFQKTGYYPDESDFFVQRNVRIGGYLYSISDGKLLINSLVDLAQAGEIRFP